MTSGSPAATRLFAWHPLATGVGPGVGLGDGGTLGASGSDGLTDGDGLGLADGIDEAPASQAAVVRRRTRATAAGTRPPAAR